MVDCTSGVLISLMLGVLFCTSEALTETIFKYEGGLKSKDFQVVVPSSVSDTGNHKSYALMKHLVKNKKKLKLRETEKIFYKIPIDGEDYLLELTANNKIVSPGAVVEILNKTDGIDRTHSRRMQEDHRCHYTGSVKGHKDSRAAISTCDGLAGYVRTSKGYFMIEPLKKSVDRMVDEPHPHAVYKQRREVPKGAHCEVISSDDGAPLGKKSVNTTIESSELHIESLVVLDHAILQYHNEVDIENFVLTVFNIAHDLFHDASLGININLAIVRLIRLECEEHEMNIAVNRNPQKTLQYFSKWQDRINPREDTHPNHHDIAILLTRIDICADDKSCGLLGAAKLAGICDPRNQVIICQDNGLRMGFTIAHEIGHALGLLHDPVLDSTNINTVMSPYISSKNEKWSNCSRLMLKKLLNSGSWTCLYDPPTDHSFQLADALPGIMYDADYQCKEIFGPNAALCMTGVECNNLICYIEDKGCVESHMETAEGTSCGENKWCFHGECVEMGERPGAVNGGWGPWSEWSACTRSCGSGVASQERHCNNPSPSGTGTYCQGEHRRHRICSTEPCEFLEPAFRDLQCSEFNAWVYPEDGEIHQWKSYPVHDENPCALYCVNELGNIATLRPRVTDGTTCYRGIRDICINGLCKEIPCDLDLESNAVEDRCGVCSGDGSSCTITRGEKLFLCPRDTGPNRYIDIPQQAMNIKIEELFPSESRIQVKDNSGTNVFITGDSMGMFRVYGSKAWVGMIRTKQEAISIPGPLPKPISIWVEVQQNSTIKYSYGLKSNKTYVTKFNWDYLDWTQCSTECGPGTQESVAKCVEKVAGLVDEKFCRQIPKPKEQIRPCEVAPCITRWYVGEWDMCTKCPFSTKTRMVKCFRPVGNGEGELDIIPDIYCAPPKPKTSQSCPCYLTKKTKKKLPDNTTAMNPNRKIEVDFYKMEDIKLSVHTELESNKYPLGLPHPKHVNTSSFELDGVEALKFLNKIQRDFSNNKTKI